MGNNNIIDLILEKLEQLDTKIDKVETNMIEHLKNKVTVLEKEITNLKSDNNTLKTAINEQDDKIKTLETSFEKLPKRNNIVVFGLENLSDNKQYYEREIKEHLENLLQINISEHDIDYIRKLGTEPGKPILISFTTWKKRDKSSKKI